MKTTKQIDLNELPEKAQEEVFDFYMFIKERYQIKQKLKREVENSASSKTSVFKDLPKENEHIAWQTLIENNKKRVIKVDPSVDIRELIDQTHDVDI